MFHFCCTDRYGDIAAMNFPKLPQIAPNVMGQEHFTITEKQAKQRQDGTWYFEVVKVEKSALA